MRSSCLVLVLLAALAGCMRSPAPIAYTPTSTAYPQAIGGYGAVAPQAVAQGGPYAPATALAPLTAEQPYLLDSGDRVRIAVFGQDGLANSYIVDPAGFVNLALVGPVPARGLTTADLTRAISDRLRAGYIRDPHVSVEIEAYRPFFILGEVTAPGQYPYVPNMTVETAVAIAGGYSPRAQKSTVTLTRTINGQTMRASVPSNFLIGPGDTITVPERWF
jgi:polysaccharide export outer membrane protein